jgi:hypothetical protein
MPVSCGPTGFSVPRKGLPKPLSSAKLDPDLVAFVEALARYAARKDHEAETRKASRELN